MRKLKCAREGEYQGYIVICCCRRVYRGDLGRGRDWVSGDAAGQGGVIVNVKFEKVKKRVIDLRECAINI